MPDRFTPRIVEQLIEVLSSVHDRCLKMETSMSAELRKVAAPYRASARNLIHYLGLRQYDLRDFQRELSAFGLSSLGRVEAQTLAGLDAVLAALHKLDRRKLARTAETLPPVDFESGPDLLARHTGELLGPEPAERGVRIMVTMPSEAATEYKLVKDLLRAGMDVMRVNCAHDDAAAWRGMVENLRRAESEVGRPCKILMDLAGPKLRTGKIEVEHHLVHWKPARDVRGLVTSPARIWLSHAGIAGAPSSDLVVLPIQQSLLKLLRKGDTVFVKDTRGRMRALDVVRTDKNGAEATSTRSAHVLQGALVRLRRAGRTLIESHVGSLPAIEEPLVLRTRDRLIVTNSEESGGLIKRRPSGRLRNLPHIPCTLPQVFMDVRPGERIYFDDGKIEGVIKRASKKKLEVEITDAAQGGSKLRSDKGINLPDTKIDLPALTDKDLTDLRFVVRFADMVGLSFVRRPEDVLLLAKHIGELGAAGIGVVLKIENRAAFDQLPRILLAGLRTPPLGVMVARGDLAVEIGFERLAEVQEEMLWFCEAAHVPIIWATQVLENMAQTGKPSRAEVTDAAMSGRAECVMLNKGPHVIDAVRFLDNVLERMQLHQQKKRSMLRKLSISEIAAPPSMKRKAAGAA
jgi:pyruvate kinase